MKVEISLSTKKKPKPNQTNKPKALSPRLIIYDLNLQVFMSVLIKTCRFDERNIFPISNSP